MAKVIVVGDGPAGLSAALLLAKNGQEVVVYGKDETALHYAQLRNYLGVLDEAGTSFAERAREQVSGFGARLEDAKVTAIRSDGDGFSVTTEGEGSTAADYVVIAGGKTVGPLVTGLGIEVTPDGVATDRDGRTAVDRAYVVGRIAKPQRSQAIISAGAGAAAALDILARETGSDFTDWDTPDD